VDKVKKLIDELRPSGPISLFSHVMFDAIDAKHEELTLYLLEHGCDKTVTKQVPEVITSEKNSIKKSIFSSIKHVIPISI